MIEPEVTNMILCMSFQAEGGIGVAGRNIDLWLQTEAKEMERALEQKSQPRQSARLNRITTAVTRLC